MTLLVVPDPGAEAYCSVAQADAYHASRGNTEWGPLAVLAKEQALRRATDYMVARYSGRWRGEVLDRNQPLDWPRWNAWSGGYLLDSQLMPAAVVNATAELALRSTKDELYSDVEVQQVTSERVGPIAVTYANRASGQRRYAYVDDMLRAYLIGGVGQIPLVRG